MPLRCVLGVCDVCDCKEYEQRCQDCQILIHVVVSPADFVYVSLYANAMPMSVGLFVSYCTFLCMVLHVFVRLIRWSEF